MIVELLDPLDADSVIRTAVPLWEDREGEALSSEQVRAVLRASQAIATADTNAVLTPFPAPVARVTLTPNPQVWLLRRWDRHVDEVSVWTDEDSAYEELGRHVRGNWDCYGGQGDMPQEAPADDGAAVRLYYAACGGEEGYSVYEETPAGAARARTVPLDYRFPTAEQCQRANQSAVFHPMLGAGNGKPCSDVAGVVTFTYLDPARRAVVVSVHLDTAASELVRPDGTVPLHVMVEDSVILDDSAAGAPWDPVLTRLLDAAETGPQDEAIREAAHIAGLLWRCPACEYDNPRAAASCTNTEPCRSPKPKTSP
ncbi:hypothetical protein ACFV99_26435 [Streptomyces sp. NPDC059944]|uniref:hypothetical protein n=1 Tax=unclassified Streptomyces TaxID=2593676 RepID=UPI003624D4C9